MKTILTLSLILSITFSSFSQKKTTAKPADKPVAAKIAVINSDTVKTVEANYTLMERLTVYQRQLVSAKSAYENNVKAIEKRWNDDVELSIQQQLGKKGKPVKVKKATLNKDSTITVILKQ